MIGSSHTQRKSVSVRKLFLFSNSSGVGQTYSVLLGRHLELVCNALDQPPQGESQVVATGEVQHLRAFQGFIEGSEEGVCEHGGVCVIVDAERRVNNYAERLEKRRPIRREA